MFSAASLDSIQICTIVFASIKLQEGRFGTLQKLRICITNLMYNTPVLHKIILSLIWCFFSFFNNLSIIFECFLSSSIMLLFNTFSTTTDFIQTMELTNLPTVCLTSLAPTCVQHFITLACTTQHFSLRLWLQKLTPLRFLTCTKRQHLCHLHTVNITTLPFVPLKSNLYIYLNAILGTFQFSRLYNKLSIIDIQTISLRCAG